jgi:hypothetical protein
MIWWILEGLRASNCTPRLRRFPRSHFWPAEEPRQVRLAPIMLRSSRPSRRQATRPRGVLGRFLNLNRWRKPGCRNLAMQVGDAELQIINERMQVQLTQPRQFCSVQYTREAAGDAQ